MKAVFIAYDQAYADEIVEVLESFGQRGFTRWGSIGGRGDVDGVPHLGNHAWPAMNDAVMAVVQDDLVPKILAELRSKDEASKDLGLRAFVWNVEDSI